MDMNPIRRRNLRDIIAKWKNGTPAQFGRDHNIPEGRLSQVLSEKYRNGNNFGEKAARHIEKLAGLPPMSLDKIDVSAAQERARLSGIPALPQAFDRNTSPALIGQRAIPVISAIQAGALTEIVDPYELGDGFSTIYADDSYSKRAFALEIKGDSMVPEFIDGDLVIIEPEWVPRPGEYVAAKNGGDEATFKKYRQRGVSSSGEMVFELVPLNENYPIMRSDITPLTIIGVMAEHRRKTRRR
jgi:SOS-response transcriptional repressor LexA